MSIIIDTFKANGDKKTDLLILDPQNIELPFHLENQIDSELNCASH